MTKAVISDVYFDNSEKIPEQYVPKGVINAKDIIKIISHILFKFAFKKNAVKIIAIGK